MLTVLKLLKRMVNDLGVDPREWFGSEIGGSMAATYAGCIDEENS